MLIGVRVEICYYCGNMIGLGTNKRGGLGEVVVVVVTTVVSL